MSETTDSLEMFTCTRHAGNLRLSKSACASMWQKGKTARREDRLFPCRDCPLGAQHAGVKMDPLALPEAIFRICVRCHRPAKRFIFGVLDVSCYNRGLEVHKGKNAKGKVPVHLPRLYNTRLAHLDAAGGRVFVKVDDVSSTMEAVLTAAREMGRGMLLVRDPMRGIAGVN